MHHPHVGLPVRRVVALAVDLERREALGETSDPDSGKAIPVQDSHSATVPVIAIERGRAVATRAPSSWTRIHGSRELTVLRRPATYCSIGVIG